MVTQVNNNSNGRGNVLSPATRTDSIRVKPKDKEGRESLSSERLKNTVELPESGYGLHTAGDIYTPSTPNLPPEGTRYDVKKDVSVPRFLPEETPLEQKGTFNRTHKQKDKHQQNTYKRGKWKNTRGCRKLRGSGYASCAPSENESPITQRKKSEAKVEGEYGPKHVRNPDKIVSSPYVGGSRNITKEEYVRSGERKSDWKTEAKNFGGFALGTTGLFALAMQDKWKK